MTALVDLIGSNWINPFASEQSDLGQLSTVVAAMPEISSDLLSAKEKGEEAYKTFQEKRLDKGEGFYDVIKKSKF